MEFHEFKEEKKKKKISKHFTFQNELHRLNFIQIRIRIHIHIWAIF